MLELYDVVSINHDDEEYNLRKGQQGTIVDVLAGGSAYVVEFYDDAGETNEDALFADFRPDELSLIKSFKTIV